MGSWLCLASPVGCAATTLARATVGDVFGGVTAWITASVSWLLGAAGHVLASASDPTIVVSAARQEYGVLVGVAPLVMLVGLMVATLQAVRHGDASSLWRVYFGVVPASVVAIVAAPSVAVLALRAVDQLSRVAATTDAQRATQLARVFAQLPSTTPGFGILLLAGGVVVGCWLLWCELIVRTVILTLLLVLVPVAAALAPLPATRRLGWRLAETFAAVASTKFLIVVALALGLDELRGSSATQLVTGAVTLALAVASPYVLLRVMPFVEQSALHHLDGLRQRAARAAARVPSSPVGRAVRSLTPDIVPTPYEAPEDLGLTMWPGVPEAPMPPTDGEPPAPPVGTPQLRGGHVVHYSDEGGPVVGWHFDE